MAEILQIGMNGEDIKTAINTRDAELINSINEKASQVSLNTHISTAPHIPISDTGAVSTSKTWSSSKINSELGLKANETHKHSPSTLENCDNAFLPKSHKHNLSDINNIAGLFSDIAGAEVSFVPKHREAMFSSIMIDISIAPLVDVMPPFVICDYIIKYLCIGNNYSVSGKSSTNSIIAEKPPKTWEGWVNNQCNASLDITILNPFSQSSVTVSYVIVNIKKMNYNDISLDDLVTALKANPTDPNSFISILVTKIQESLQ